MEGQPGQSLMQAAIIPALSGFLLCLGLIGFAAWRPAPRPGPWRQLTPARRRRLLAHTARLLLAGYAAFLAIVLVYSVLLQHESEASSAPWGVLFLLAITLPVWALATWRVDRRARDGS
jgi:TRAP-type uncharacterized transport system fused permease subunit